MSDCTGLGWLHGGWLGLEWWSGSGTWSARSSRHRYSSWSLTPGSQLLRLHGLPLTQLLTLRKPRDLLCCLARPARVIFQYPHFPLKVPRRGHHHAPAQTEQLARRPTHRPHPAPTCHKLQSLSSAPPTPGPSLDKSYTKPQDLSFRLRASSTLVRPSAESRALGQPHRS